MTGRGWTETHPYGGGLLPPQFTDYANNADRLIFCFARTRAHPCDACSYILGFVIGRAKISFSPGCADPRSLSLCHREADPEANNPLLIPHFTWILGLKLTYTPYKMPLFRYVFPLLAVAQGKVRLLVSLSAKQG